MNIQTILATAIVLACVLYMGRYAYLRLTGKKSPCSCCPSKQNRVYQIDNTIQPK